MIFSENWAVFAEGDQIRWKFGDVSSEMALLIARLAKGMSDLGKEIFKESVASFRIRDVRRKPPRSYEILIVQFGENFFFIASDPVTTAKMLRITGAVKKKDDIPGDLTDLLHGVLMGQALETYADLWSAAASEQHGILIDQIFTDALHELAVPEETGVYAKDGVCSFSGLDTPQLLFLHSYLRKRFEKEIQPAVRKPWACILGKGGVPIYLVHNISQTVVEQQLAFLFTAVAGYVLDLFESVPEALILSQNGLTYVNLFVGEETIFAVCNPLALFQDAKFIINFSRLSDSVMNDILVPTRDFLADQIGLLYSERLHGRPFRSLIEALKEIHGESSVLDAVREEVKLIVEEKTFEEVAIQLQARDEIDSIAFAPIRIPSGTRTKIILTGDPDTGKSSIRDYLVGKEFAPDYVVTVGAQFSVFDVRIGASTIPTQIWDSTGKQKLEDINKAYYAGASAAFVVFDVTRPDTFEVVEKWIDDIWDNSKRGPIPIVILGNLADKRGSDMFDAINDQIAFDLAVRLDEHCRKEYGFQVSYLPVSAKSGRNLSLALQVLSLRGLLRHLSVKSIHEIL